MLMVYCSKEQNGNKPYAQRTGRWMEMETVKREEMRLSLSALLELRVPIKATFPVSFFNINASLSWENYILWYPYNFFIRVKCDACTKYVLCDHCERRSRNICSAQLRSVPLITWLTSDRL